MPIRASRAVIRRVLQERAAVLIANAPQDLAGAASIMGARIQSIIGVPLWEGDDIPGGDSVRPPQLGGDVSRARPGSAAGAGRAGDALAIENARLHQRLRMAEKEKAAAGGESLPQEPRGEAPHH